MNAETEPFVVFLFGVGLGALGFWISHRKKVGSYQRIANKIIQESERDAERLHQTTELELKKQRLDQQQKLEEMRCIEHQKILQEEKQLKQKEEKLEARMHLIEKKREQIDKKENALLSRQQQLHVEQEECRANHQKLINELERASGLTANEAKKILIKQFTQEIKAETAHFTQRIKAEAEENAEKEARKIIVTAIHRLAVPCVSEVTVQTVTLPSENMKGRIIGREGRNIRTLERTTGVNFMIDDTPDTIVLSGFDPIRLHVAKFALSELVLDGRIHPYRIEQIVEKTKNTVENKIKEYGEDAALRAGQMDLHPELITLLGKLKFRSSYGQNVLKHSLEVSHLMGLMAGELHLDVAIAKRIGLLHDMGKAISHEMEGTHAVIGHDIALKYGESPEVATGIGSHHNEMAPMTIEGSLCTPADALSASRPGARIEAVEKYIKRLKRLEEIAYQFPGIEKAYAMQAGKEICISVLPDMIDDDGIVNLARDLTKRIEKELQYPGKIKVIVIREKRAVEYAV